MTTGRIVLLKAAADVVARAASLLTFPILARYAGPDGYGAYGQLNTVLAVVVPLASLGLTTVMVRFFTEGAWTAPLYGRVRRIAGVVLVLGAAAAALMAAGAPLLNDLFLKWPGGTALFRWGSLLVVLGSLQALLLNLLTARTWFGQYVAFQFAETALLLAATLLVLPAGYGIVELVQVTVALKAGLIAVNVAFVALARRRVGGNGPAAAALPTMIRFGLPFTIAGLGLWAVNLSDRLVVGFYMTAEDLGRYAAVYALAGLLGMVSAPLFLPAYPRVMRATRTEDRTVLASELALFQRFVHVAVIPMAVFLVVFIPPVLVLLGGASFRVDALLVGLVVAGTFVNQWNGLAHYVLASRDRTLFLQNVFLGCGAINIALNLVVVPAYGLRGAAAVTFLTFLVLEAIVLAAAYRPALVARLYLSGTVLKALAAALVAAAVAAMLITVAEAPIVLTSAVAAFWITYVAVLAALGEVGRSDLALLRGVVGRRPAGSGRR